MKKILVGLDRDDTISVNPDEDYGKQENWRELLQIHPTVIDGIRLLNEHGCTLVVASNQSGIARGLFPHQRQQEINDALANMLKEHNVKIHNWQYCPFYSQSYALSKGLICNNNPWILNDNDLRLDLRKPMTGMLIKGVQELGLSLKDFTHIAFVGDRITDVETGLNANGIGIMIKMGKKNHDHIKLLNLNDSRQKLADNFYQAAKMILDSFL